MTEPADFASATPVFRVEDEVQSQLSRDLTRVDITEDTAGLKTLVARFIGRGPKPNSEEEQDLYLDGAILDFGKKVKVSIGREGQERTLFEGLISALEVDFQETQAGDVIIRAEDKLMELRMTRKLKTYKNVSDADVASSIANDHGLTPSVDADGPTYDVLQQWNMSDLAFLRYRAQLIQAEVWISDTTLNFKSRSKRSAPSVTLVKGNQIINYRIRADLAHQRTKIKVSGYDASARDKLDESADVSAIQAEISGGRTGPGVLQQAFGERVSYRVREVPLTDTEATDFAKAEMLRRGRAFVTCSVTTDGTPEMVVGTVVELQGVGKPFEGGSYYVTHVCQTFDLSSGHRTYFEAERATLNEGS